MSERESAIVTALTWVPSDRCMPARAEHAALLRREAEARAVIGNAIRTNAASRETLSVLLDNGGHDGLRGEGVRATLDGIDRLKESAEAWLAAAPEEGKEGETCKTT